MNNEGDTGKTCLNYWFKPNYVDNYIKYKYSKLTSDLALSLLVMLQIIWEMSHSSEQEVF